MKGQSDQEEEEKNLEIIKVENKREFQSCLKWFGSGPLSLMKKNLNDKAYTQSIHIKHIFDDSVLPTTRQNFGEGLFLFQYGNAPMHKDSSMKNCSQFPKSQFAVEELASTDKWRSSLNPELSKLSTTFPEE